MPQNFLCPQRDQPMLMPVDMREWLPEDDLVFVVLDAVATLDLDGFRRRYRADGHGRAAFDPEMMVALLLYGYCQGERSSRVIEKRCLRDVAYRVIAGGLHPDHATIARFRARHEKALGGLFSQVLRLLAAEGMVSLGLLSLDGTKRTGRCRRSRRSWPRRPRPTPPTTPRKVTARNPRRRGRWPAGPSGGSGWPGPGTGSRLRTRRAGTRSGPGSKPGSKPQQPGNGAGTALAMSRAPTGPGPSRGRTSPTRTCG
jgi:transposase